MMTFCGGSFAFFVFSGNVVVVGTETERRNLDGVPRKAVDFAVGLVGMDWWVWW